MLLVETSIARLEAGSATGKKHRLQDDMIARLGGADASVVATAASLSRSGTKAATGAETSCKADEIKILKTALLSTAWLGANVNLFETVCERF